MSSHFPLEDQIVHDVLMHLFAHFSGDIEEMISYYTEEKKGCTEEITVKDIIKLQNLVGDNVKELYDMILSDEEKSKVEECKKLYQQLRGIYNKEPSLPKSIADLILSEEDEEDLAIQNILEYKSASFQPLVDLVESDMYYDSLSPGYGKAPLLAIKALGLLNNSQAVPILFHVIGKKDFFIEDAAISALVHLGESSKEFLLRALIRKPINRDNENAAIVLNSFSPEEDISKAALSLLEEKEVLNNPHFASHLILNCSGLKEETDQDKFKILVKKTPAGALLQYEINQIYKNWKTATN